MHDQMQSLPRVLRAAEINRDHFQYHLPAIERAFGGGITDRSTGPGSGTGSPRLVTPEAAAGLAIGFRLMAQGVATADAFRIGLAFVFFGETGDGHRGIAPPEWIVRRVPGQEVPETFGDTLAVVIPDAMRNRPDMGCAYAFTPERVLTPSTLKDWTTLHDAGRSAVLILNISEVLRGLREGLEVMN